MPRYQAKHKATLYAINDPHYKVLDQENSNYSYKQLGCISMHRLYLFLETVKKIIKK